RLRDHLRAGAVAGDHCDAVNHASSFSAVGMAERPSSAWQERKAHILAAARAFGSGTPWTNCASNAPWKTSPAPRVLTMSQEYTFAWICRFGPSHARLALGPRVTTTISAPAASASSAPPGKASFSALAV